MEILADLKDEFSGSGREYLDKYEDFRGKRRWRV